MTKRNTDFQNNYYIKGWIAKCLSEDWYSIINEPRKCIGRGAMIDEKLRFYSCLNMVDLIDDK